VLLPFLRLELRAAVKFLQIKFTHISQQIFVNYFVPQILVAQIVKLETGDNREPAVQLFQSLSFLQFSFRVRVPFEILCFSLLIILKFREEELV